MGDFICSRLYFGYKIGIFSNLIFFLFDRADGMMEWNQSKSLNLTAHIDLVKHVFCVLYILCNDWFNLLFKKKLLLETLTEHVNNKPPKKNSTVSHQCFTMMGPLDRRQKTPTQTIPVFNKRRNMLELNGLLRWLITVPNHILPNDKKNLHVTVSAWLCWQPQLHGVRVRWWTARLGHNQGPFVSSTAQPVDQRAARSLIEGYK